MSEIILRAGEFVISRDELAGLEAELTAATLTAAAVEAEAAKLAGLLERVAKEHELYLWGSELGTEIRTALAARARVTPTRAGGSRGAGTVATVCRL